MKKLITKWYNQEGNSWYHNNELIRQAAVKGLITAADYKEITGEDY